MHPNRKFQLGDAEQMAALVREAGFGVLVVETPEGLRAAHVPVLMEGGSLRFHVSKGNAVHSALCGGCDALLTVDCGHAYVSPDWYGLEDRVPTWNYVAVEIDGRVRPLDDDALVRLLDDLSEEHERRLLPKLVWKRDKMTPGRFEGLLKAITGFEMEIESFRGTAKIDQDKPAEVRERIAAALEQRGERIVSALMRSGFPGG